MTSKLEFCKLKLVKKRDLIKAVTFLSLLTAQKGWFFLIEHKNFQIKWIRVYVERRA